MKITSLTGLDTCGRIICPFVPRFVSNSVLKICQLTSLIASSVVKLGRLEKPVKQTLAYATSRSLREGYISAHN